MTIISKWLFSSVILIFSMKVSAVLVPISDKKLQKVHSAIFDTFAPFSEEESDTTIKHLLETTKKSSFELLTTIPDLRSALFLFDHLHLLHNKAFIKLYYRLFDHDEADSKALTSEALRPIKEFIHSLSNKIDVSIIDLSLEQRLSLFTTLIQSDVNLLRLLGFYVRIVYTQALYEGALGEKISGLRDRGFVEAAIVPSLPALKTPLRYNREKKRLEGELDAIIIGSGASGSVAAHEMQKNGMQVLVLESGPMVIPGAFDTASNLDFMEGHGPRLSQDGSIALLNGATVGGGTTINLDMSFPPTLPHVLHRFHQWHEQGLIDDDIWSDAQLADAYDWVKGIFEPRRIGVEEINANNRILLSGAALLGIPAQAYELNTYKPGESPFEVYHKKSSFEKLLLPAMLAGQNPLTVLSDCKVTRVLIKNDQAYGVECRYEPTMSGIGIVHDAYGFQIKRGAKIKIYAKNIILAAGNLGSSNLLLNSKIKNPNIGRGFVAHPFISFKGRFDRIIRADQGEPSTIYIDHFMPTDTQKDRPGYLIEAGLGRMSLWALLQPGTPRQVKHDFSYLDQVGGFSVMVIDTPNPKNRVKIDKSGNSRIFYHFSESDKERLKDGIKRAVKILFAAGATDVSFNSFEYPLFQKDGSASNTLTPDMDIDQLFEQFTFERNQTSLLGAHMMAGNKMGTNPETSVVDKNYQVWGVGGLYVIDGSVFPSSVGANPMQTIYTTAKIFVDGFLRMAALRSL